MISKDRSHRSAREKGRNIKEHHWLVVWNMNFMTFHILGIMTPTDFHIF